MKAAVIGHPTAHSKSPKIHQYWLKQQGIEGSYEALDIAPEDLAASVDELAAAGYDGFNVTLPYKQAIIALCDDIDETAKQIGAVNTVIISGGKLYGTNTDAFGFVQNIKSNAPDFDFSGKNVFVLGAGGASRAVLYGLLNEDVARIKLCNRTVENAQDLKSFAPDQIDVIEWNDRHKALADVDLLVNTTALGMTGKPALELDLSALPTTALVNDIVYAPLMTELLSNAKTRGNKVVTGIGMLLHQARPAFELWSGVHPEVTDDLEKGILA